MNAKLPLVVQWDLPFGISSPVVQLDPALPIFFPTYKFVPSDTVGPIPAKLLPYLTISPKWHSGTCLLSSSSLVVQWGPPLPNFFPTCNFIPGGTVGLTLALVLPYFTIYFLVVQWDLPPCYFSPSGTVGPTPAKLPNYMQIRPSGTVGPIYALVLHYFTISSLVVQWDLPLL